MVDSSVTPQDAYLAGSAEIHRSRLENFRDAGMATVFYSILCQSSSAIYDAALLKVKNFLAGRVLEPKISGRLAVCLIRGLVKVDASKGLAAFLPTAIEVLRSHASSSPTFQTDEHLDDEFSFNQLIFFEVSPTCYNVQCLGSARTFATDVVWQMLGKDSRGRLGSRGLLVLHQKR